MLDITNFPWAECTITENRALYISDSLSFVRSKRSTGSHRYEFELVTVDMDMAIGRKVHGALSGAVNDTLEYIHPRLSYTQGKEPTGGIYVSGLFASGNDVITFYSASDWELVAGDYIQFDNDTKVYQVKEGTGLVSGAYDVKLTHPIRYDVSNSNRVVVNDVKWTLESDGVIEVSMEASENQDMQITLVGVEKL